MTTDAAGPRGPATFLWGGVLLFACAVLRLVAAWAPMSISYAATAADVAFAGAAVLFAFGLRPHESAVARRPLGVTALLVLAAWPLMLHALNLVSTDLIDWADVGPVVGVILGYGTSFILLAAAIVACVQIARAGVVPRPLHLAPTVALALVVAGQVIVQAVVMSNPGDTSIAAVWMLIPVTYLVALAGLGFVSLLVWLLPARAGSVQVYPPPSR